MANDALGVYAAINSVQAELASSGITKSRENSQQKYMFRGIDDIYNAVSAILAKNRLCIIPRVVSRVSEERQSRSGGTLFYVTVEVHFDFVSAGDGSSHTAVFYGEAMDSADKATNKAMSAAYKYMMLQTFCIPTEGDNDADARTHEPGPPLASHQQISEIKAMLQSLGKTWNEFSAALGKGHPAYAEHESELNQAAAGFWLKVLKKRLEEPMTESSGFPTCSPEVFKQKSPGWRKQLEGGRSAIDLIALIQTKLMLTDDQKMEIAGWASAGGAQQ